MNRPSIPLLKKGLLLGRASNCLKVADIRKSLAFYKKLGFKKVGGDLKHRYVILQNGPQHIALFQGHIKANLLNFRGGNVAAICKALKAKGLKFKQDVRAYAGGEDAVLVDPDGNTIYFDTTAGERLY